MPQQFSQKFRAKKSNIIRKLGLGDDGVPDASPKGSVDEGVRELIALINTSDGFVTTSSCAGRIAVFAGGKGGGGDWLYTSHISLDISHLGDDGSVFELLGLSQQATVSSPPLDELDVRMVHFKFEPLILHVLTANLDCAQRILDAALGAGFRESGIVGARDHGPKDPATPMVGIRSQGLAFESIIAYYDGDVIRPMVTEDSLRYLIQLANKRFTTNEERKARFTSIFTATSTVHDRA